MRLLKGALVASTALVSLSTTASADIINVTFGGTVSGADGQHFFGAQTTYTAESNTAYVATFVVDTNLAGAIPDSDGTGRLGIFGGTTFGVPNPVLSASLTINNITYVLPINPGFLLSEHYVATFGEFYSSGVVGTEDGGFVIQYSTAATDTPTITSLNTPFSYVGSYTSSGVFTIGGDSLNFNTNAASVAAVPEPSTWAMLILGFCGLGFTAHRRKDKLALRAA
jgi:hypothetical protein